LADKFSGERKQQYFSEEFMDSFSAKTGENGLSELILRRCASFLMLICQNNNVFSVIQMRLKQHYDRQ